MNERWTPHATVATIVEQEGKFLMVEEIALGEQVINQPAGHMEAGETVVEAAVRETLEETGWHVERGWPYYFLQRGRGEHMRHWNSADSYKWGLTTISFGKQTWPHLLVRVMLIEQIYRAFEIIKNSKYHK